MFEIFSDGILFRLIAPFFIFGVLFFSVSFFVDSIRYKLPLVIIGVLLSFVSVFYFGKKVEFDKNELEKSKIEISNQQKQVESEKVTTSVVIKYVDKIKVIEKERIVYVDRVKEVFTTKIINDYPIPELFVRVLESSAEGKIPDPAGITDGAPSEIKIDEAATYISENYDICRMNAEKLISLQNWVRFQQKVFNSDQEIK